MINQWQKYTVLVFSVLTFCLSVGLVHAQTETAKHIVVIDPAHGGEDTGVLGVDKVAEKDIALAIALALQKELAKEKTIEIVLTRDADKAVTLEERKNNILKIKPALVLSLHVNAGFGRVSSGFELYYPGFKDAAVSVKSIKSTVPGVADKHLNETVRLARLVQKNLDALFPRKGRGLREATTPIAEGLSVPVLVVELGFVTNPDEKKKLISGKTQTEIAKALANSIKSFF